MLPDLKQLDVLTEWKTELEAFEFVPPGQISAWSASRISQGEKIMRFATSTPGVVAVQGVLKHSFGIDRFIVVDGPLLGAACDEKAFIGFIEALREHLGRNCILSFSSIQPYDAAQEVWLRKAGLKRPWVTILSPLTLYVDCSDITRLEQGFRADWRKSLRKAQKNNLVFEVASTADTRTHDDLAALYAETFRMRGIDTYPDIPTRDALAGDPRCKVFFASYSGKRVSARLVVMSGEIAFDTAAGTDTDGRKLSASHFLVASIFDYLHKSGVRSFDFGRIGPGQFDSIDHFKYGSGGRPVAYLGEWVLNPHPGIEFALGAVQYFKHRKRW